MLQPLLQPGAIDKPTVRHAEGVQAIQPWQLALFRRFIARRRLRAQFRAVRLLFADRLPAASTPGLIFYLNHPSWWDPLLCMVLAQRFIPGRHFYAPMDADQLQRYAVLRHLGLFPVEANTPRGAAQFLRAAETVLRRGHVLGLTPQGALTDVRARPPRFKPGLGALMARMERAGLPVTAVPVALEYTFWNQRLPEALVAIGDPVTTGAGRTTTDWTATLQERLAATQEALAEHSAARRADNFETLLEGRGGISGLYGLWERVRGGTPLDHVPE